MIEQKYIKLINLYVDNEISEEELAELNDFINRSDEGKKYFKEMTKITSYLSSSEKSLPNINVKKNILNSLDHSKYIKSDKNSFSDKILTIFAKLDRKIVLSFSSGIAVVIIFFTLFGVFEIENENVDHISGSLTPINNEVVSYSNEYIINEESLKGTIQKNIFDKTVNIDLGLNSKGENHIAIDFDKKYFQFAEITNKSVQNLEFELNRESLYLNISGESNFQIIFNKKGELESPNSISITINDKKL